jgi:GT2 family glycosyltransferase
MKKIIIVTLNYNNYKDTKNLLSSLEKIEKKDFQLQIIIVDNGSKIHFQLNNSEQKNYISVIRSDINTGFAGGNNIGILKALEQNADYILLLNNDTKVYSDMIKNLLHVAESDPKIGIVVPKIYFAKGHEFHKNRYNPHELGKVLWYAGGFNDWNNVKSIHLGMDEVDHGQYDTIGPTEFATGCCMFLKKVVLEKVGLFDSRYFLYYEDSDFNERVKRAGYKIYYNPQACLLHVNAASSDGPGNNLHDYFLTRNQMLFGFTYAPFRTKIALIKQSIRLLFAGRQYQKRAIMDFYFKKFGSGSFFENYK